MVHSSNLIAFFRIGNMSRRHQTNFKRGNPDFFGYGKKGRNEQLKVFRVFPLPESGEYECEPLFC